jgi:hypothetical protein
MMNTNKKTKKMLLIGGSAIAIVAIASIIYKRRKGVSPISKIVGGGGGSTSNETSSQSKASEISGGDDFIGVSKYSNVTDPNSKRYNSAQIRLAGDQTATYGDRGSVSYNVKVEGSKYNGTFHAWYVYTPADKSVTLVYIETPYLGTDTGKIKKV